MQQSCQYFFDLGGRPKKKKKLINFVPMRKLILMTAVCGMMCACDGNEPAVNPVEAEVQDSIDTEESDSAFKAMEAEMNVNEGTEVMPNDAEPAAETK